MLTIIASVPIHSKPPKPKSMVSSTQVLKCYRFGVVLRSAPGGAV